MDKTRRSFACAAACFAWLCLAFMLSGGAARAQSVSVEFPKGAGGQPVQEVVLHGLDRTRRDTVLELLPRPPPASYSDAELREFERRLSNLSIFDHVRVTRNDETVDVDLREKWTLIPMVDFSTGTTWADTYAALFINEYNFFGRAMWLSGSLWHAERGWNGAISWSEHQYHPARGSLTAELDYANTVMLFDNSELGWDRLSMGGVVAWLGPLPHGSRFNYQIGITYHYERNFAGPAGYRPPHGHELQAEITGSWENFRWHDLVPHGLRLQAWVTPGMFLSKQGVAARSGAFTQLIAAHAFGETTVLMAQLKGKLTNLGNANHSFVLGSWEGVRGFEDAVHHTWLQGVFNIELRQAWRFAQRWALQGVLFGDAAAFEEIEARGNRGKAGWAASAGAGVRLVPTFLAEVVLRIDVARSFWPEQAFFFQWGLSQYF